jgi:hypothetical protein
MKIPGKELYERFEEWVIDRGTRLFARLYWSGVEDTSEFTLSDGEVVDVYLSSKASPILGQTSFFNTIILNRRYFGRLTPQTQELIVRHELSHARRQPAFRGVFWGMLVTAGIGILALFRAGIWLVFGQPIGAVAGLGGYGTACLGSFLMVNRIEETTADYQALQALGEDAFIDGYREIEEPVDELDDSEPTLMARAWKRVCYSRPTTVARLNGMIKRFGQS